MRLGAYGMELGWEEKRGGPMFWCRTPRGPKILHLNLIFQVVFKVYFVKVRGLNICNLIVCPCTGYLLLYNELAQNLAAQNNTCLLPHSFWGQESRSCLADFPASLSLWGL